MLYKEPREVNIEACMAVAKGIIYSDDYFEKDTYEERIMGKATYREVKEMQP